MKKNEARIKHTGEGVGYMLFDVKIIETKRSMGNGGVLLHKVSPKSGDGEKWVKLKPEDNPHLLDLK